MQEDYNQTMLHQEKSIRTQVSAMIEEKSQRMRQLKSLSDQDQDLCDLLCTEPFPISSDRVPSTEQLDTYRQHIIQLSAERVHYTYTLAYFTLQRGYTTHCLILHCRGYMDMEFISVHYNGSHSPALCLILCHSSHRDIIGGLLKFNCLYRSPCLCFLD